MTDHSRIRNSPPLSIGGKVLYQWLLTERRRLARRLVAQFGREISAYGRLSDAELIATISLATEENLRVFAESLRDQAVPPTDVLVGPITASAARRAGEGMPLDAVMAAYSLGMLEVWREMVAQAASDDLADVLAFTELVLGYLQRAMTAVAASYLEERRRIESDEQQRRHTLISALLRGEPFDAPAGRAGFALPSRFLVLRVRLAAHKDEAQPGMAAAMAAQRKVYRASQLLGPSALSLLDTTGGVVLVPADEPVDGTALAEALSEATGVETTTAGVVAEPSGVADAARQAQDVLELAEVLGRGPGFHQLADLLLEYQLTRPSPARAELSALLAPLDAHPDVLSTLALYLRLGLNRRKTASQLHVHPNTVDYRLRRAVTLTGLDPADPTDLQKIGAALVIRASQSVRT
nr:helix-turn-helix domain-containing protein [Kibdelosporangium sp. MJ126-NF4]CEL18555.1 putative transcriptional regulator [Kibdelosporangium sp. MJ126-NF4]CTQ98039.1 putative transcriptional regulator [Kibdelosporangium sp. MJ126-NF4]